MSASNYITRRGFLKGAGAAVMGLSAAARLSSPKSSYARVIGANDRISIGIIGCGQRGLGAHMPGIHAHDKAQNVEITAVCDPWSVRRDLAAAKVQDWYGRQPRKLEKAADLIALDGVDAVMIASCDHQHTTHLEAAAKARKDVYCEKPLAMDFDKLKAAVDAVKANKVVVQAGTQLRSMASFTGCRELHRSGALGKVSRIEQCRNATRPYWYGYLKDANEKDVNWAEFLMDRPARAFSAVHFTGWYGFRDFSDGPVTGLGSHFIDLVHYITGATFPTSCVADGGIFTWKDANGFTCDDHVQATWIYPEGFLVSYSTNFGNGGGNSFKLFGQEGVMDMLNWSAPTFSDAGAIRKGKPGKETPVPPVERADHFLDWLQCLRTRKAPNASIDAGYQHAVAVLMAVRARDTGRRQVYDVEKRQIREEERAKHVQ